MTLADEHREQRLDRERLRFGVARRLRPDVGISLHDLSGRLELPGGTVGLHAILRVLVEAGEAHKGADDLWYSGKAPSAAAAPMRIEVNRPAPPRASWLSDLRALAHPPEPVMPSRAELRARVVEDVRAHPGSKAGDIARRVDLDRGSASRLLAGLRVEGALRLDGTRSMARWWVSSSPPAAAPGAQAPLGGGPRLAGDDLAVLDVLDHALNVLAIPQGTREFRIGVLVGLASARAR